MDHSICEHDMYDLFPNTQWKKAMMKFQMALSKAARRLSELQ